jgi:Ca2+/Na+ antiporter
VLAVLAFALLPAAQGKWRLGRLEAVALIVGYAAYLAASAFLAVRTR